MYVMINAPGELPLDGVGDNTDIEYFILFQPYEWRVTWLKRVARLMYDKQLSWSDAVEKLPPPDRETSVWVVGKRFEEDGTSNAFLDSNICIDFFKA